MSWLVYSILSILLVHSFNGQVDFAFTLVTNRRPYEVSINCLPGIPIDLAEAGAFAGDSIVFPVCVSSGMWLKHPAMGWRWGDWAEDMDLYPGHKCALLGSPNPLNHFTAETYLNCCWGPFCNPGRRQLFVGGLPFPELPSFPDVLPTDPVANPNQPNGEEFCEGDHMLRNAFACQQSSCCHWNTWEYGEASFNGQGRCWSSIGTQTCNDVHTRIGLVECHDEPTFWYDSDGPYYDCQWYRQDRRRCEWYGHWYQNFGKTANEACCGCRHQYGRRQLEEIEGEDHIPKRGFLFTNEIASGFNVESSEMVANEGVSSTASQCQERSWWDYVSLEHPTLECSAGEAIGAFYKTSLPDVETWSVERGYCCAIDASDECIWKEVDPSAKLMTCDGGYVLSGFKMDDEGYLFSDVEEIKCCKQ